MGSITARAAAIALCSLFAACASIHRTDITGSRPLLPPASLNGDHAASQIVHGAFGSREMTMNCVLTVRGDLLTVIGLTAMGVRAFTLRYDGKEVRVENDLPVPPQLTPERLLADIQLVFWPLDALQPRLRQSGFELTEPFSATRRLRRGATLVAEVHYENADPWRGRSWLVNLEHSYTLGIESTSMTDP